jgi:hypothetical protein
VRHHAGVEEQTSGEFDAQAWLKQLHQGVGEQAAVAAQRPTGEQLSVSLGQIAEQLYEWTDLQRLQACHLNEVDPQQTYRWVALKGSLAELDVADVEIQTERFVTVSSGLSGSHWWPTNPTRNQVSWGLDFVQRCFHSIVDNLSGIARLVTHGDHVRAPITLARSSLEAAATACSLVDPDVEQVERLRRSLNLYFAQLKESSNERRATNEEAEYEDAIAELNDFATHIGLTVRRYRPQGFTAPAIVRPGQTRPDSTVESTGVVYVGPEVSVAS